MKMTSPRSLMTLLAAGALLSACADADPEAPRSDQPAKTSSQVAQPRLVVASDAGAEVLAGSDLERLDSFGLASRPKLQVAGDDRHVFVLQSDAGKVGVVDAGTWSEAHGDHSHHYTTAPSLLDTSFDRGTSYHAVSDDERSIVWFDDDASFDVFDWKGLEDDDVDVERVDTGRGHHGVAVPLADGGYLASYATGEDAEGVKVLDADGRETDRIGGCEGLHGEAHAGDDAYAFGCSDGVLVVEDGQGTKIASPEDGAATRLLVGADDSDVLVGSLNKDTTTGASDQVALYDLETKTSKAVDVGAEYYGISRDGGQSAVVGTDGNVHVIDDASGEVVEKIAAVEPWTMTEEFSDPKPAVEIGGGFAWVSDPSTSSVSMFELGTGTKRSTVKLDDVPTSMVLVNRA